MMTQIIKILQDIGTAGIDFFWLPVGIWTVIAIVATGTLKLLERKISVNYHYHARVALLWSLAAGVFGSALVYVVSLSSAGNAGIPAKFIVIQNPITIAVQAQTPAASINWWAPDLWAGIITSFILLLAAGALLKLALNFVSLHLFSKNIEQQKTDLPDKISLKNRRLLIKQADNIRVLFSEKVGVPFTFGWHSRSIVLPQYFLDEPDKLNMALRHELIHIANNDYLINATVTSIKALFCFHPLVHALSKHIEEYREQFCDQHVLQDAEISPKTYASLLYELSPQTLFKQSAAVNMAVRPSTLKKRIQAMKNPSQSIPSLKWSVTLMLLSTLIITGLMACSDIEENGITSSEVEDVQSKIHESPGAESPLYVVNDEVMNSSDQKNLISRIKVKYIKSINVLKGDKATEKYGDKATNGVIEIAVIDKEKALSDLRTEGEMKQLKEKKAKNTTPAKTVFQAVESEPKLMGGIAELQQKVEYPEECRQANAEGPVYMSFVVTKEGNINDPEVIRGIGHGCDEAALQALKMAKFEPGMHRGVPVNVRHSLRIVFRLSNGRGNQQTGTVEEMEINQNNSKQMEVRNLTFSNGTLKGKVYTKDTNELVASANVFLPELQRGAATNKNGEFTVANLPEDYGKLRISYVGYATLQVTGYK